MPDLQTTIRKGPRRKYFYGFGQGDTIHAYTPEEWGLGGSVASNASNSTHSLVVLILIEAVITVPALLAPITGGWFFVLKAIREEIRARKFRQARGLPKPWYAVTDDQARNWFEQRAGTVAITRENFPNSARPFPGEERADG